MGAGTGGDPEEKHIWLGGKEKNRIEKRAENAEHLKSIYRVCLKSILNVRHSDLSETFCPFIRIKEG